jgi:hypothetical protein
VDHPIGGTGPRRAGAGRVEPIAGMDAPALDRDELSAALRHAQAAPPRRSAALAALVGGQAAPDPHRRLLDRVDALHTEVEQLRRVVRALAAARGLRRRRMVRALRRRGLA